MSGFRPVDPKQSFPELEQRVLERWREDRRLRAPARAAPRGRRADLELLRGPADRQRQAGLPPRARARRSRTSTPATGRCAATTCPRKAGWDCHGLPVELEIEKELGISSKAEIEDFGIAEFNAPLPRVGVPLRRGLEPADRADRLLDRPRRPLRHADQRLHRVGLVVAARRSGTRAASTRATRSSPTARAAGPRSRRTRSRRATTTSRTRRSTCGCRSPRSAQRPIPEPPIEAGRQPARLDDDAVDPDLTRRRRRRARRSSTCARGSATRSSSSPQPLVERVLGEGAEVLAHFPGAALEGVRYEAPFDYVPGADFGPLGHSVLLGDFVTHRGRHRARAHRARLRRGRLPARRAVRDDAAEPGPARRSLRRPRPRLPGQVRVRAQPGDRRRARGEGTAVSRRGLRARLPALLALRDAAALLREGELVHPHHRGPRPDAGRERDRSAGAPSTSSTGASASGWRATSTGRSRGSATGARRCRSGSAPTARCDGRLLRRLGRRAARARRRGPRRPAPPVHRRRRRSPARSLRRRDAAGRGGDRRLVRLGRDAVRAVSLPVRERGRSSSSASRPTTSARRRTRRAAGSTRCSPSRRCSSTAELSQLRLPRPDPRTPRARRCRRAAATSSTPGRSSTPTAPTPSAGTT